MARHMMERPNLVIVRNSEAASSIPEFKLSRKVLAYSERLLLAEHHIEKGWVGAIHSHPHEQLVYVVNGHLRLSCEGKTFDLRAGDTFLVRGGVEHGVSALEDSLVVDVFTPCRSDFIAST